MIRPPFSVQCLEDLIVLLLLLQYQPVLNTFRVVLFICTISSKGRVEKRYIPEHAWSCILYFYMPVLHSFAQEVFMCP